MTTKRIPPKTTTVFTPAEALWAFGQSATKIEGLIEDWKLQEMCGAAWDLGAREWQLEQSQVAFDRLLAGLDGSALELDDAVKLAIGDGLVDRAEAVIVGSGREYLFANGDFHTLLELYGCKSLHVRWSNVRFHDDGDLLRVHAEGYVLEPSQSRLRGARTAERCSRCGLRSVNGERKTIGCMPGGEHDYRPV